MITIGNNAPCNGVGNKVRVPVTISIMVILMAWSGFSYSQENVIRHLVQPLETYYSLSVRYNVTIDEIKAANPGLVMPKTGEYLNIPTGETKPEARKKKDCNKLLKSTREVYDIALLIPLYLEQTLDSGWAGNIDPDMTGEINPFRFIQFYDGFMLAADSMVAQGMNLKVHVYDVDNQSYKINLALSDPDLKNADLIVGPFLKNSFSKVAEFARTNRIPIVNPFSPRRDILEENPYVFKLVPSPESQPDLLGKLVQRDFSDYNVIIYTANKYQGSGIAGDIRSEVEKALQPDAPPVIMLDYASDSIKGFLEYASATLPNLIIVYSENEAMPTGLLSKLNAVKSSYIINVIGMPEWDKFNNLESGYLQNLNSHVFMAAYCDYESGNVKHLVRRYRSDYLDEPLEYALTGFSAGYYFMQALFRYGEDCMECLDHLNFELPQNQFYFEKLEDGGYENVYWNILQYYDFRLVDRSVTPR